MLFLPCPQFCMLYNSGIQPGARVPPEVGENMWGVRKIKKK